MGKTKDKHWKVEGTEVLVSNSIETTNPKCKSAHKTLAHELQHLIDFLKNPKKFEEENKREHHKPHDERSHEKRANETGSKVNEEIYGPKESPDSERKSGSTSTGSSTTSSNKNEEWLKSGGGYLIKF